MTSDLAYPAQKEFSFLQTVVNDELGHRLERKDSNKDNGTLLNVTSLQMSTSGLRDPTENMKTEQREEKLGEFSRNDDNGNKIWEDFLTDEEKEKNKGNKEAKTNREVTDDTKSPHPGQSEKESETITYVCITAEKEDTDGGHDELNGGHDELNGGHDELNGENLPKKKKKRKRTTKKPILKQAAARQPTVRSAVSESQPSFSCHGDRTQDRIRQGTGREDKTQDRNRQDTRSEDKTQGRSRQDTESGDRTQGRSRQDTESEDRTQGRSKQDTESEDRTQGRSKQDTESEDRTQGRSKQDTESEARENPGPKLSRRQRVSAARRADPVTSEQILHQKIQELHTLMMQPLTEPVQYLHQTRQELLRLQGVSQQQAAHFLQSVTLRQPGRHPRQQPRANSSNSENGYTILRSVQVHMTQPHRPWTSGPVRQQRPWTSGHIRPQVHSDKHHQGRPYSAGHQTDGTQRDVDENRSHGSGVSENGPGVSENGSGVSENGPGVSENGPGVSENGPGVSENGPRGKGHGRKHQSQAGDQRGQSSLVKEATSGLGYHRGQQGSPRRCDGTSQQGSPRRCDGTSKSSSAIAARESQQSDTHLKNSHNPDLRKWLKQKNKDIRRQKAEERKRTREERAKKQDDLRARQDKFQDSEKKVKEWMVQKKKEARKRENEKRREMQEDNKFRTCRERQRDFHGILRTRSLEHVPTHTHADGKSFVPVIRPATVQGETSPERELTDQSYESPVSKFVFKRPVSGHVRLIKLQQVQADNAKRSEEERKSLEKRLAEEKSKKMRLSYDQWLLKKREENYTKRQEMAKQKALAKSDPELERILPELARRRIENIKRGKKRLDAGMENLDNDMNTCGGVQSHPETPENSLPDRATGNIEVSGQKKVLRQRPTTAKSSFNPRECKSPRRPMSANLPTSRTSSASNGDFSQSRPFRLPFPPQEGAPKYVISAQKKLFSPHVTSSLPQSPGGHQEDRRSVPDTAPDSDTILHQAVLQAGSGTGGEGQGHTDLDTSRNRVSSGPHEEGNSFFVTHGNLTDVKHGPREFIHTERDNWTTLTDELDISHPENVEHFTKRTDFKLNGGPDCEDNNKSRTESKTCENGVTEDSSSNNTSVYLTHGIAAENSDDESTSKHKAANQAFTENMAVLEERKRKDSLELSGFSASGKHVSFQSEDVVHEVSDVSFQSEDVVHEVSDVSFQSEDVVHEVSDVSFQSEDVVHEVSDVSFQSEDVVLEVSDVSEASDIDKSDRTGGDMQSDNESVVESKNERNVNLDNTDDDDDDDGDDDDEDRVLTRNNIREILREDVDDSSSYATGDLPGEARAPLEALGDSDLAT